LKSLPCEEYHWKLQPIRCRNGSIVPKLRAALELDACFTANVSTACQDENVRAA
jgi:hypothetical protein